MGRAAPGSVVGKVFSGGGSGKATIPPMIGEHFTNNGARLP